MKLYNLCAVLTILSSDVTCTLLFTKKRKNATFLLYLQYHMNSIWDRFSENGPSAYIINVPVCAIEI